MMKQPTVISTFAGCGGSSLGYKLAGFHELLAVEWDDNAVATFKANFPEVKVFHGDIAKLTGEECMKLAGVGKGELDVFDGSPPCQGFSTAGKRKFTDPRNSLFKEFARLLEEMQPKTFVMENVTGLVKGHMKQAYLQIVATLRGCGYRVRGEVLNAAHFGVAQARQRVIIIGVREDLGIEPSHPKPKTSLVPSVQALMHVPDPGPFKPIKARITELVMHIKPGENGADVHEARGEKGHHFSLSRLAWEKPAPTILKSVRGDHGAGLLHPDHNRLLGINEVKALFSFPPEFMFFGKFEEQWGRIGNCVPPLLMKAIAEHLKTEILEKVKS
jgi:DNA (cytosine-5)-methyltransferase 1